MMRKQIAVFILLVCTPFFLYAQSANYEKEMDLLFRAFKNKDYSLIKPMLDDKMKIGNFPHGMNDMVIPQVLNQLPEPQSYKVTGKTKEAEGIRIQTEYTYVNSSTVRPQSFLFNSKGKIIDFDVLAGAQTSTAASTPSSALPEKIIIPFEVRNGLILVKAKLNGEEKKFILDSGSPALILNSDVLEDNGTAKSGTATNGVVGGSAEMGSYGMQSFDWYGIKITKSTAITMSLKHPEGNVETEFSGLIGYKLFKDYQVTLDYHKKEILLELTDDNGEPFSTENTAAGNAEIIPFEMKHHLPVFKITIHQKAYKMALDCGASSNLLYAKYLKEVSARKNFKNAEQASLDGAGKQQTLVKAGLLKKASVGRFDYPDMLFAFQDETLEQLNTGYQLGIDGLLGFPFLKENKTRINYKKKQLTIFRK